MHALIEDKALNERALINDMKSSGSIALRFYQEGGRQLTFRISLLGSRRAIEAVEASCSRGRSG